MHDFSATTEWCKIAHMSRPDKPKTPPRDTESTALKGFLPITTTNNVVLNPRPLPAELRNSLSQSQHKRKFLHDELK